MHGATGKLFKLQIKSYFGTPEGGTGMAGGAYLIDIAALQRQYLILFRPASLAAYMR